MTSVRESVKEKLVGSTEEPQLSHQARSNFLRHAQKDENGELFMNEDNFIDAVAPKQEDYVSLLFPSPLPSCCRGRENLLLICLLSAPAQNQARAIWHPVPRGRPTENRQAEPVRLGHLREPPCEARRRVRDRVPTLRH